MEEEIKLEDKKILDAVSKLDYKELLENDEFKELFNEANTESNNVELLKEAFNPKAANFEEYNSNYHIDSIDRCDLLPSKEIIRSYLKQNSKEGFILDKLVEKVYPNKKGNIYVDRDASLYLFSLSDKYSLEEKMAKTLKYIDAIYTRDDKVNPDDSKIKPIILENIESLNLSYNMDLSSEQGFRNVIKLRHKAFLYDQFNDANKGIYERMFKNDPISYYKLSNLSCFYKYRNGAIVQDIFVKAEALTNYGSNLDVTDRKGILSYSSNKKKAIKDTTVNVTRIDEEIGKAFIDGINNKNITKFDADVSIYSIFGQDNSQKYNLIDKDLDFYKNTKDQDIIASRSIVKKALENAQMYFLTNSFYEKLAKSSKQPLDDMLFNSIYINGSSLKELADDYLAKNNETMIGNSKVDKLDNARAIVLLQAFNDPTKVVSITSFVPSVEGVKANSVILNKNYDALVERCSKGHNIFARSMHALGLYKYEEEKVRDTFNKTLSDLDKKSYLENINKKVNFTYRDGLKEMNKNIEINVKTNHLTNNLYRTPIEVEVLKDFSKEDIELLNRNAKEIDQSIQDEINHENNIDNGNNIENRPQGMGERDL